MIQLDTNMHFKHGRFSPSRFADLLTKGRGKSEEWGLTALEAINEVALERIGVELPEIYGKALDWGNEWEPIAVAAYEEKSGIMVQPCTHIIHPEFDFVGGTPDGLINDDGMIEIKCPFNPTNHLGNLTTGLQIEQYTAQIQGYMWITGRQWCDFVSFDARFPEGKKLFIKRIERDEEFISILQDRIIEAEKILQTIISAL